MIALIDADIVAFRVAAASEDSDLEIACLRADKLMQDIIYLTEADSYKCILTGRNNFRKTLYPEYKANRKDKPKPKWLQDIRTFLQEHWNAEVSDGCEADDLLGVYQTNDSCICSIDKDLLQIPGRHYNWVKAEFYEQTLVGGLRHFYFQLLQGDKADNIPGIQGIGPKKAERYLEGVTDELEMFKICYELYKDDMDTMIRNGQLLWIWRTMGGIWDPSHLTGRSHLKQEQEVKSNSTKQKEEESSLSTEHTWSETQADPEILGM